MFKYSEYYFSVFSGVGASFSVPSHAAAAAAVSADATARPFKGIFRPF
jgi:hypothetical protein